MAGSFNFDTIDFIQKSKEIWTISLYEEDGVTPVVLVVADTAQVKIWTDNGDASTTLTITETGTSTVTVSSLGSVTAPATLTLSVAAADTGNVTKFAAGRNRMEIGIFDSADSGAYKAAGRGFIELKQSPTP